MTRTFLHSFYPPSASPITAATVDLNSAEIETRVFGRFFRGGAPPMAHGPLDALLTPTGMGTAFIFREPLGQAREVKVALSGLFDASSLAPTS